VEIANQFCWVELVPFPDFDSEYVFVMTVTFRSVATMISAMTV
jgi:hypothetical protein